MGAQRTYAAVRAQAENWLVIPEKTSLPVYQHAFLITHEAREGIWILLYWWTGGEMLNRSTWFASNENPEDLKHSPEDDRLVCVWELEIIQHERNAWVKHVLEKANQPDFAGYREDYR